MVAGSYPKPTRLKSTGLPLLPNGSRKALPHLGRTITKPFAVVALASHSYIHTRIAGGFWVTSAQTREYPTPAQAAAASGSQTRR